MTGLAYLDPLTATVVIAGVLLIGGYLVAVLDHVVFVVASGRRPALAAAVSWPLREAALRLGRQPVDTEAPDRITGLLAPAAYLGLAAAGLSVVPLAEGVVVADVRTGIVVFGAAEALAIVAVFLRGWSPNSALPLVGGYNFVGVALSYELLSMFVLIAAALPAESLALGAIVESQRDLWNVVRQPLGLPLFLVVALGVTFRGPLNIVEATDLASGAAAEDSGAHHLLWSVARAAMLVTFAAAAAAAFLGGWHGPVLPGALWMALKTAALVTILVSASHVIARISAERFVTLAWTVLLPLAFADLAIAGLGSLP